MDDTIVYVVDDEPEDRRKAVEWLEEVGIKAMALPKVGYLFHHVHDMQPFVVILDMQMNPNGLDSQQMLVRHGYAWAPVIFLTNYQDIDTANRCHQAGAYGYMSKAPGNKEMLQQTALRAVRDAPKRLDEKMRVRAKSALYRLSPGELEVFELCGNARVPNGVAAKAFCVAEQTLSKMRTRIIFKLEAHSWSQVQAEHLGESILPGLTPIERVRQSRKQRGKPFDESALDAV